MIDLSALPLEEAGRFFSPERHAVVALKALENCRVVWLNRRARLTRDVGHAGSIEQQRRELLISCGVGIDESGGSEGMKGVADRYGGRGLGSNGGSGRAAFVNGYYVKGVGRTPLIGRNTEPGHASGGAYLEECARETILSELVDAEFPYGSVPTVGIIDTGEKQVWQQFDPPKVERRCLLVRPAFIRPAHFERAVGFLAWNEKDGYLDRLRVEHMFNTAMELLGRKELLDLYRSFWAAWSEQLAYAFVHRLPHGGDNTSNIALDGRLLDFASMAAVPSWASISLMLAGPPVGESLAHLIDCVKVHAAQLGRYVDATEATAERITEIAKAAAQRYQLIVYREMLRVAGLTRRQAEKLLYSDKRAEVVSILSRLLNRFRRDQFAIFAGMPEPRIAWDVDQLWSDEPPAHLRRLRALLVENIVLYRDRESPDRLMRSIAGRCAMRTQPRAELYQDTIKKNLFRELEIDLAGNALNQDSLDRLISGTVCRNRRDSTIELDGAIPIGFARNTCAQYALFRCIDTAREFAVREWDASLAEPRRDGQLAPEEEPERLYIRDMNGSRIVFASPVDLDFSGPVSLL